MGGSAEPWAAFPDMVPPFLTVGELTERLRRFADDLPVAALYDCRCAGGSVVDVEVGSNDYGPGDAVVLVIE